VIANALHRTDLECAAFMTEVRNDTQLILVTVETKHTEE